MDRIARASTGERRLVFEAAAQPGLLEQVVRFKEKLYRTVGQAGRREAQHAQARPSKGQARRAGGRLRLDEADAVRQLPEHR